jgi:hypothetical protein
MDGHDRLLKKFLAGDLDPAAARRWDEHLLECEQCWRAVREDRDGRLAAGLLRQQAPAGLAERIRFAVEVAAAAGPAAQRQARPGGRSWRWARACVRPRWGWLAGAGTLAAGLAVIVMVLLLPGGRAGVPAAVAAVARYAETIPAPALQPEPHRGHRAAPVEVGRPVTVTAGGQRILVRTWQVDGVEAVVAVSGQPFPMPPGAQGMPGGGMAWSARLGKLGLYCINGRRPELVAAPVPAAELAALVSRLPLA